MDISKESQLKYVVYKLKGTTSSWWDNFQTSQFMRLASRNKSSEYDAQQVARLNNGLHYDIQAIISLHTTWSLDEVVQMALKAEQTMSKQGKGNFKFKAEKKECFIQPEDVLDDEEDDQGEAYSYVGRRLMLTTFIKVKTSNDTASSKRGAKLIKMCSTLSLTKEVARISSHKTL
ncbi:hypothetical protein Tco_0758116 [Tanacetum coccineum]